MNLEKKDIERFSALNANQILCHIKVAKSGSYDWIRGVTLTGDAPKEFVRLYKYVKGTGIHKRNKCTWSSYIAKTGHKWYPNESITEYLFNALGSAFGLNMAESDIVIINGQLRFLSKYFLDREKEMLVHGAEIFAGYLEDEQFVEDVEEKGFARDFFTLQFVETATTKMFPQQYEDVLHELVRLLLFDAFTGNNDRHYYNWGVIRDLRTNEIRFSPVYDTARGLFWNDSDERLIDHIKNGKDAYIRKYCKASRPKLGWEGVKSPNHFDMASLICENNFHITKEEAERLFSDDMLGKCLDIVENQFADLFIPERRTLIKDCLTYRYRKIKEVIK